MVLVLRTTLNELIELKNTAMLNFLDFSAAFDSCSTKSLDESIQDLGGSRKMRALVRAMQGAARGRMRGGQVEFDVDRGVLQGDRLSPLLFVVCLAAVLKDRTGGGIEVGGIKLDMLGYALPTYHYLPTQLLQASNIVWRPLAVWITINTSPNTASATPCCC